MKSSFYSCIQNIFLEKQVQETHSTKNKADCASVKSKRCSYIQNGFLEKQG